MEPGNVRRMGAMVFGGSVAALTCALFSWHYPPTPCTGMCEDFSFGIAGVLFSGRPESIVIAAGLTLVSALFWAFAERADSKKIAAIMLTVMLAVPRPAHAIFGVGDIVFDPTVYANAILQLNQEIAQVATLKSQLQNMITNTTGGMAGLFQDPSGLLGSLGDEISQAEGLSYSTSSVAQDFQRLYHGSQIVGGQEMPAVSVQTALNTLMGVLSSVQRQHQDFGAEDATLMALSARNMGAIGNLQINEVGNEIALHEAKEQQLARQLQMSATNAMAVATAAHMQAEIETQNVATVVGNMDVPDDMADPANNTPAAPVPGMN